MIDPKTDPGSEQHETIERYDLEVAPRVRNLPPYLFGKINELKYRKRRDGVDVIDLGMGNPTDPPEDWVIDKLCEAARDSRNHRYSAATGIYNLRREVANRYESRFGVSLDPDQEVVATIGSKEGFSHMCLALLGPGDTALVPAPSFPIHIHAVALASANVISLDVRDGSSFLTNIARTCESLYPRPKILVINYPHNPTATVVDRPFFEEIVALAKKYRFFVIHDFAYGDIGFDGYLPPSFLSVKGAKSVGCEFTTMSKGYNMAGWRVGFAAGNRDMLGALKAIKGYYDYGIFQAVQVAAIVALRHGESGRLAQVAEYQLRRDAFVRGLKRSGWDPQVPKGGMFVWTAIPEPWRSQSGSIEFSMKLLEHANVAVSPGRGFGETGEGFLRLALVENEQRLRQAVRQVARYLRPEKAGH
jgi:alanine-synthesizing transaminase